jgi:2-oxo-hept-3-ene-1,7-dioate hydratase
MITLSRQDILKEAERHHLAEKNRQQISAVTSQYPDMTISDAYEIQSAWTDLKLKEGRTIVGHKIGLTSKVMQRMFGIDEPDFGILLDDMVFQNNSHIQTKLFLDPHIEVELAFCLKQELSGSALTIEQVFDATEYIVPSLELIAARSFRLNPNTGYKRTVRDTISDNAANAGIILGDKKIDPKDIDMRWISSLLYKNNIIEESGVAAAVLDHPANGIIWLAKRYAEFGRKLLPGQIILSGSFTSAIKVEKGDHIKADFNTLGMIECHFD